MSTDTGKKWRWSVAYWLDRHFTEAWCWSELVMWALHWKTSDATLRSARQRCPIGRDGCYCGKWDADRQRRSSEVGR